MKDWYWLRLALGLGLVGVATRIFLADAEAHVTMCMLAAALYGVGLMLPNKEQAAKITSFAFFGIAFYTVYAATTFLAYEQFFAGPSFSPDDQIVPGIDFAWVYHTIINFYLLGLFWLGFDRMRTVAVGLASWLMAAPLMFLFAAMGRELWLDYEPPPVIIGYTVVGGVIALLYWWLRSKPDLLDRLLAGFRKLLIITLWVYVVISFIPYVQLALGQATGRSDRNVIASTAKQSDPQVILSEVEGSGIATSASGRTRDDIPQALDLRKVWSRGQCQGSGDASFTYRPMRPEDTGVILPYGLVTDAHVTPIDHMYFSPIDRQSAPDTYEVRAIADGFIVQIGHRVNFVGDHKGGNAATKQTNDWRLDIEHTCDLYSYFDLITSLEPEIMAEVAEFDGKMGSKPVRIPIRAGQLIGHIGGQTLDFGVYDNRVLLDFLVPEHYVREAWKVHTVDPFPFFEATVRQTILDELARFVEPRAGKIDYDVDGRLIGNWFAVGTDGYNGVDQSRYWDGHLAVVPDYLDPTQIRFSIGNFGGKASQFAVIGNSPRPEDVSVASGIVTYELVSYQYVDGATDQPWQSDAPTPTITTREFGEVKGVALVQLLEDRKLKVEVFPGKTAGEASAFTAAAREYER